jgi:type I restriction enzyme S subunit
MIFNKLKDVCRFQSGNVFPKKYQGLQFGDIPFIKISDMNHSLNYKIINFANNWVSTDIVNELKLKVIPKNAIVFAKIGEAINAGRLRILSKPTIIDNNMIAAIPNENIDFNYLFFLLSTLNIADMSEGTAIPFLRQSMLENFEISIPPLPEQKAIASVLSSLDDKIDLLHRQNKTLEAMADALFRQYFIENPDPNWRQQPLTLVAQFLNGLACQKYPPKDNFDRLPVLKIKELNNGITKDSDYVSKTVNNDYIINSGDIIFSWSGSLVIKIWFGEKCVLNQHLYKVTSKLYHKWFYYQWCKYYLQEFIAIADSKATTMGHIKRSDLDNALVIVPDKNYINLLNSLFDPIIDKIINNNKQLFKLSLLRDILLPKLMSRELYINI